VSTVFPDEARVGETISVYGQNFGASQGSSTLRINDVVATQITGWSDNLIVATVPAGAITGNVTVTVNGIYGATGYLVVPWQAENPDNVAVSTATGEQTHPRIVADGAGGAIVVWQDARNGNADIYAQRISSTGAVQWDTDGVLISTAVSDQLDPQIVSDGTGGAIMVWRDFRNLNADIYAQRINSAGVVQWASGGVAVSTAVDAQTFPQIISDGAGGAIIVWQDARNGNADIYAQRINSAGAVQWASGGVAVSTAVDAQTFPQIISDGAGGAIIVWQDAHNGNADIYAQRINSAGAVQWASGGVAVSTAVDAQTIPQIITDGAGGAIIVWQDLRTGNNIDIYAQRINSAGAVLWVTDGMAVSKSMSNKDYQQIVTDGAGGAIIVWQDARNGNADIYAQRINNTGAVQWAGDDVAICTATRDQEVPQVIADGANGAIVVWQDLRHAPLLDLFPYHVYSQRVNSIGAVQWYTNGIPISMAENDQLDPQIVDDGTGGAIMAWWDYRSQNADIYAQGITRGGRQ
jgi:hypothetical protein